MINAQMKSYNYFTLGADNGYGQAVISEEPKGTIKMAINISTQAIQDNINYKNCSYIGLTQDNVDDTYIIQFGKERLKVLYINPLGRYKQVFLAEL